MTRRAVWLALLAGAATGVAVALDGRAFVAVAGALALAALCVLAYRHPGRALSLAVLLVLVAGTKFGNRDETASLSGTVDGTVVFELGLYAVVALIVAISVTTPGFRASRPGGMEWWLIAFAALALASTVWSIAPMLTLVRAGQLVILVALALVAVRVLDVGGTAHALGTTVVGYVLVCAAIAVAFPATRVTGTVAQATERFSWFAMHSISAATFTAVALLYLLCRAVFLRRERTGRFTGLVVLLLIVPLSAVMVATNSRGPLFSLIGAVAAVVAFRLLRPVTSLALTAAVTLVVAAASVGGVTSESLLQDVELRGPPLATIVLRGQDVREFGTLTGRTELWSDLVPLYLDRPAVGYGYQASRAIILRLQPWAGHAHNALLQTLLDLGAIGVLPLWLPFVWALCVGLRARAAAGQTSESGPWARGSMFAVLSFMLLNAVSDIGFAGPPGYELLLFLCAVAVAERLGRSRAAEVEATGWAAAPVWGGRPTPAVA